MKHLILPLSLLIFSPVFALAGPCPQQIDGLWNCHDRGMPGDGSDETTFQMQVQTLSAFGGQTTGFVISDKTYSLDGQWAPFEKNSSVFAGPFENVENKNLCENGTLVQDYQDFIFNSLEDQARGNSFAQSTYAHQSVTSVSGGTLSIIETSPSGFDQSAIDCDRAN